VAADDLQAHPRQVVHAQLDVRHVWKIGLKIEKKY
jgi:hypothetical protein